MNERYCMKLMKDFNEYGMECLLDFEVELLDIYFLQKLNLRTAEMFYQEFIRRQSLIPKVKNVSECKFFCSVDYVRQVLHEKNDYKCLQPRDKRLLSQYEENQKYLASLDKKETEKPQGDRKSFSNYSKKYF